ncbi:MAG: cation:proton antiporter [Acidobacteriia bacterium]|nr:cation:proton antiporter [Terriglobia bacterium]MBV8906632.1 cation:proton antiporter [Terriglobia bacterium]MBV9746289.1 cation:proton antiporter [Terriglobia bacterium]
MPPGAEVPLSMLVVFASAKLLSEIFERLGQPGIVGEILAGVLIGPHALRWMAPNQALGILSDLGVMFLLFRIGLEVRASELFRVGGTAMAVACSGVGLSFVAGLIVATLWGAPRAEAVFTGAAMVATSVGITAQVLASRRLLETRAAKIILAAAVADDVLGLIVLSLVTSFVRGRVNYLDISLTAAIAVAFTGFMATVGHRTVQRVMPRVQARVRLAEGEFALAMTLLFALALLAVYAGVAAIVGAFLAGMALGETVDQRVHQLTNGVTELLVPFFLVGIGLRFDVSVFATKTVLLMGVSIAAAAVAAKFTACSLAAFRVGRPDAIRVGVGMIPHGEVGMVVAQIGLSVGVMAQSVYGIIVFMSVATTLLAPPLLKLAFRQVMPAPGVSEEIAKIG